MTVEATIQTELIPRQTLATGRIHQGDCIDLMQQIEAGTIDLAFADPPFNIGYEYDEYHDRQDDEEYVAWSRAWIAEVHRVLKPNGTFWLAIGDEYAAELKVAAEHQIGFATRSWVVWYYTFGVNCTKKFSRSHVHLFHFVKDENNFTFNAEDPQVRVPSARALVYADKRANPIGRLPDDTWILRPQDLYDGFQPTDDTWYYARVAGTFKERQGFHGCQMPEQLLGRIIRTSASAGAVVLDPFAGSGTTLAVAKKLRRQWIGCELSEEYVRAASERLNAIREDDPLDGAADPIASAPSTANGRRLGATGSASAGLGATGSASAIAERNVEEEMTGRSDAPSQALAEPVARAANRRELRELVRDTIVNAFYAAHDGYSIDWLLANLPLQTAFHEACREAGLIGGPADWNRELLRLRKQGAIPKRDALRKASFTAAELDVYDFAAEIAWRQTSDKFARPSLDEILCDPLKAAYFDRAAKRLAAGYTPAHYRWAALRLRKASHELVRDVKRYHFVFTKRDFARFLAWDRLPTDRLAGKCGIYLLRGEAKQPLYVGRALDLGHRLAQHADCPMLDDNTRHISLIAGDDLPGEEYLPAFKEELVRRYQPRWNVNLVGLHATNATD
ncbi:MAG: DNA methyltransferase [Pirellulales bacterium]